MEANGVKEDGFEKALDQANAEFKQLYTEKMKYLKKTDDRVTAAKMVIMRARDIEREKSNGNGRKFVFTITAFDPEAKLWDRCPGCGDPNINRDTDGHKWQGCYTCDILLGSNGTIKSMDHSAKKTKTEPWGAKAEVSQHDKPD